MNATSLAYQHIIVSVCTMLSIVVYRQKGSLPSSYVVPPPLTFFLSPALLLVSIYFSFSIIFLCLYYFSREILAAEGKHHISPMK